MRLAHRKARRAYAQSSISRLVNVCQKRNVDPEQLVDHLLAITKRRRGGYSKGFRPWMLTVTVDRLLVIRRKVATALDRIANP